MAATPQFPEVVGDHRLLRFLRSKQYNVDEACRGITAMLEWRRSAEVDEVRQATAPPASPTEKKSWTAQDLQGQLLVLETFAFDPNELLQAATHIN